MSQDHNHVNVKGKRSIWIVGDRAEVDLTEDYVWAFINGATKFFREVRHQL